MSNQIEELIVEELEDGEVSNDSDGDYTPLERPENYSNLNNDSRFNNQKVFPDSESEEEQSTELDSDSDSGIPSRKIKKPKIKLKPKVTTVPNRRKKYDIWSTRVQEDVLSETLNSCDVTKKDRSRDIESYDYVVSARYQSMIRGSTNKRTREDRKNIHLRLGKRTDNENKAVKGKSRNLLELATTLDDSVEDIARDIANKLHEQKEELLVRVVNIIGKQKCFDIFEETRKIEADGGLPIINLSRRRTPGGVFLYLVRMDDNITRQQKDEIFSEENKKYVKEKKKRRTEKMKKQRDLERAKLLPELLKKADTIIENRVLKEVGESDVINPPPTPETDAHENSCDGMENIDLVGKTGIHGARTKPTAYDDDFLDLACSNNDMELF